MMAIIKNKEINWWKVVLIIFITAFALLMLVKPNLAPTDDFILLRTLQSGRPLLFYLYSPDFRYGDVTNIGRFIILGQMEYNFFGFFSKSPSPFWYFLFHTF